MTTIADPNSPRALPVTLSQAELLQGLSVEILGILNEDLLFSAALERVTSAIKQSMGFDAVGIRLRISDDYPYITSQGYSDQFLLAESSLVVRNRSGDICRDEQGNARLDCICGLVISGGLSSTVPTFTPGGSFWINHGRQSPGIEVAQGVLGGPARNRCLADGYLSMALVPIRAHQAIVGLLQLNDRQAERISLGMVRFFEGLGAGIGLAVMRKQAEEGLRKSEAQYRLLFEMMTEGFALHEVICDADGKPVDYRYLDANPAFERITGIKCDDAVGRTVRQLLPNVDPSRIELRCKVALTGVPVEQEGFDEALGRHYRAAIFSPQKGQFATLYEDTTARKLAEAALLEQHAELERFTYAVSHDLKSPLVTIQTFLTYLEQDVANNEPAAVTKDVGFIRNAAGKMSELLEELLKLSRVGRVTNPPEEVPLIVVASEALSLVAGRFASRGISVNVTHEPVLLHGDLRRLVELFQNLLDNAAKFMGVQPDPQVEIGIERAFGSIVLFVRDNGIGFEPQQQSKLFGLFNKLDPDADGTGIGLALVRRIVQTHRGKIWAESAGPGQGATFKFTLADTKIAENCERAP